MKTIVPNLYFKSSGLWVCLTVLSMMVNAGFARASAPHADAGLGDDTYFSPPEWVVTCGFNMSVGNEADLNAAIACFNAAGAAGLYTITLTANIPLTASTTAISNATAGVELKIAGAGFTVNAQVPAPSTTVRRPFNIAANTKVTVENLTIKDGNAGTCGTNTCYGGGIINRGFLTLIKVTLTGNRANQGGGLYNAAPGATLAIRNSLVNANTARVAGGGLSLLGTTTVDSSTVSNNLMAPATPTSTTTGGGIMVNSGATLTISYSTVSGNVARFGSGIYSTGSTSLLNTTVSGNQAGHLGGGLYLGNGSISSHNSTVANNTATTNGSGVYAAFGSFSTANTIVASPSGSNCSGNSALVSSAGHNLSSDGSCPFSASGDLNGLDPKLATLADNGGPTKTHALLVNSPAISGGGNALIPPGVVHDQRGPGFNRVFEAEPVDIGAFESDFVCKMELTNCPEDITVSTDPGECDAVVSWSPPEILNCPEGVTINSSSTSGSTFGAGVTFVTVVATDGVNTSDPCEFTVTVTDDEDPTVSGSCSTSVVFNGEPSFTLNPANLVSASDNCGIDHISVSPSAISCSQAGSGPVPITVTVTDVSGNSTVCNGQVAVSGLPCGWSATPHGIACTNGNQASYNGPTNTFTLATSGCYTPSASADESGWIKYSLCGDGSITAHVAGLTLPGYAGIMMRETDAAGAKKVGMVYQGASALARYARYTTNGFSYPSYIQAAGARWLRIVRTGDVFKGYYSGNGVTWVFAFTVTIPMQSCIQVGLVAWGTTNTSVVTATFNNVVVTPPYNGVKTGTTPEVALELAPSVDLWPNPTGGAATLELDQAWGEKVTVEIRDGLGRLVHTLDGDATADRSLYLDLKDQAPGVYFIRVQNQEGDLSVLRLILARD